MRTVIGITGGIASGKSTVADMFRELGAEVLDADEVARQVVSPGSVTLREIERKFGPEVINADGSLDRLRLAEIVFADPQALQELNRITHPRIIESLTGSIRGFRERSSSFGVLVVEIPLLIEAKLMSMVDKIVLVFAEQEAQQNRLRMRGSLSEDQIKQRIGSQMSMQDKIPYADWVITTDCSIEETKAQVARIWNALSSERA